MNRGRSSTRRLKTQPLSLDSHLRGSATPSRNSNLQRHLDHLLLRHRGMQRWARMDSLPSPTTLNPSSTSNPLLVFPSLRALQSSRDRRRSSCVKKWKKRRNDRASSSGTSSSSDPKPPRLPLRCLFTLRDTLLTSPVPRPPVHRGRRDMEARLDGQKRRLLSVVSAPIGRWIPQPPPPLSTSHRRRRPNLVFQGAQRKQLCSLRILDAYLQCSDEAVRRP